MTTVEVAPRLSDADLAKDLDHGICECSEDWALCGIYMGPGPIEGYLDEALAPCVVCWEMDVCPKCGDVF